MSDVSKAFVLEVFRENGRRDALDLRGRAGEMDGTAIIAEEAKIPAWDGERDYSAYPVGAPVAFDGQVYGLLQPHHAGHYPGSNPGNTPALWGIKHTTDPARAKEYVAPLGTSGIWMAGECCRFDGGVWRCLQDNVAHSPGEYAAFWEMV